MQPLSHRRIRLEQLSPNGEELSFESSTKVRADLLPLKPMPLVTISRPRFRSYASRRGLEQHRSAAAARSGGPIFTRFNGQRQRFVAVLALLISCARQSRTGAAVGRSEGDLFTASGYSSSLHAHVFVSRLRVHGRFGVNLGRHCSPGRVGDAHTRGRVGPIRTPAAARCRARRRPCGNARHASPRSAAVLASPRGLKEIAK